MGTKKSLPAAIKIYKGLSIYRVNGSMNWYVRIWDSKKKSIWLNLLAVTIQYRQEKLLRN